MFVIGNLLGGIAKVLDILLTFYMWIIIIASAITWVRPDPYNPIVRFLYGVTEPVLRPIRKRLGHRMPIDFSPLIAILVIIFLQYFLVRTLNELAVRMH